MTPVWNETDMNAQRGFFHFHPGPGAQIYLPDLEILFTVKESYERYKMSGRINGLDTTSCSFSSPFLCTQQLSLLLSQHRQSVAVTHLHFVVWLSCLSNSCSDKWN